VWLLVVGCLSATAAAAPLAAAAPAREPDAGPLAAQGGVGQVAVTGAAPLTPLRLVDRGRRSVARGTSDSNGALLVRNVAPGRGYHVVSSDGRARSGAVEVLRPDQHPPPAFYRAQHLGPGYQYLTTRDGTTLAVNVRLPGPPEEGPYPTVVEYSGYDPANPDSNQPGMRLAETLGYATVGVNMRGTGCSGGAWEYFDLPSTLDGYDAIETIAAQPWVAHGRVGMVGISYSGITQLFVAATRPPHLAAITPLSAISDTYRGVLYPGGILNTGFAVPWAEDRQADARAAPTGGQGWARRRVAAGDATCAANQALRGQTRDVLDVIRANEFYSADRLDHTNPTKFVDRIRVPTFLAGAWQDEQTGGYWPAMIEHFSRRVPLKVTMTNGTHAEPFGPEVITRWAEFLDFYVARRIPTIPAGVRATAARGYVALAGVPLELPPDRFAADTDFHAALARYEAEPPVRVLFDNGAGGPAPGAPVAAFERSFDRWPPSGARPWRLSFAARGALSDHPAAGPTRSDRFRYDPDALPATDHPSGTDDFFGAQPDYDWRPLPDGVGIGYVTDPLRRDVVVLGPASADLWLRSSAADTDLEVVITEVRPDGAETYVQSGWLRASHRALDRAASTSLAPVPTHTRRDAHDLPRDRFVLVRVPIFPFGHVFRAGSRVRVIVQPPGGNRPRWAFAALAPHGSVTDEVARGGRDRSSIVLPVVDRVEVPSPLPPCGALRGQPCRRYVASTTGG
jgi:predicted acyl esterase